MYEIIVGRTEEDKKKYGTEGIFLLGKHYVKMGRTTSLSNEVLVDVARTHVVFVCGKRGSGKCVTGDTLIPLSDGSLMPMETLAKNREKVFGLNNSLKMVPLEKSEFFEREVDRVIKLRLRSGRDIKLTPEHPLLTIKGWKPVKELNLGSRVATERKIECFGNEKLSENKIKLLAYLIAEGHTKGSYCLFSNADNDILKDFEEAVKEFDSNLKVVEWPKGRKGCYGVTQIKKKYELSKSKRNEKGQFITGGVRYKKSSIVKWLIELGCQGKKAKEKDIPQQIFRLNKKQLSLFLNRLFSCDGSIYKHKASKSYVWQISYSSSSKTLARQVQHLLLRFGILSRLRTKKVKYRNDYLKSYELVLNPPNVIKFIQDIGFFGNKKNRESKAVEEIAKKIRNPNVDTVPRDIWDFFRPRNWAEVGRAAGYKHPKAMRERIRYSPSRQTLLQVAEVEQNQAIINLAKSDVFWDEVVSMELLEGTFKVYDFCVPELHNFVANDIIIHNSYSLGVIAEGLSTLPEDIAQNLSIIILDTMGIFWTMKYENKKDEDLLKEWKVESQAVKLQIYTPQGYYEDFKEKGIPTDFPFSIRPSDLNASDWCMTFDIKMSHPIGVLIERIITELSEKKQNFSMDDIIKAIKADTRFEKNTRDAAENRFMTAKSWGLFSTKGTKIDELAAAGKVTVLDVSCYSALLGSKEVTNLVIGLVSKKLFTERMVHRRKEELEEVKQTFELTEEKPAKKELPLVWLMIDEAHEFLPKVGETTATQPLLTLLREGRQPGISLVLASQQPGQIHTDVMTQSDIVLCHRITARIDIEALGLLMQSYLRENLDKLLNDLPRIKGAALIFDDTNERMYPMQVRPRFTWHGGQAPTPIRKKKELFKF